jgi:hypothetical protein
LAAFEESLAIRRELDRALGTPASQRELAWSENVVAELRRGEVRAEAKPA